ncbi:MAG: cupin domain-containing protein [Peptococcaceae bacterium]|nr:cupin domain-containing protein [Peptococcaceae bacterium]
MFVSNVRKIQSVELKMPGIRNAFKQSLIGPREGWEGWVMRLFTLKDEGCSPRHSHPWPHINYVVSGRGTLYLGGEEYELEAGSVAYVPSGAEHQFLGKGGEDFVFICIVPEEGDK